MNRSKSAHQKNKQQGVVTRTDIKNIFSRFGTMDQRFDKIDQRFNIMDVRFEKMDQRFDKMDQRFDKADQRFDKINAKLESHKEMIGKVAVDVTKLRMDMNEVASFASILSTRWSALSKR